MEGSTAGGVAFVGPGSEWFWIALQFFALAGTFFAIYRQLRAQQREIRESTQAQQSLGYNNSIRLGQRPLEMLIQDESLARISHIGDADPDGLTEIEWARYRNFMFLQFNAWEFFYYQNRDKQIPKELWVGANGYYVDLIKTRPGLGRFWNDMQHGYDEPFRSHVAGLFAQRRPKPAAAE